MTTLPAVIFAGGLATRMGGGDRGLRRWRGGTLPGAVMGQIESLMLNANGGPGRFAAFGLPGLPL